MGEKVRTSDRRLATTGQAKRLYERIIKKNDAFKDRSLHGKAIYGPRKPSIFTGNPKTLEKEKELFERAALGRYKADDISVYIVNVEEDLCVAEALKDGQSIWWAVEKKADNLLNVIFAKFQSGVKFDEKPKTISELTPDELRELATRKESQERVQ